MILADLHIHTRHSPDATIRIGHIVRRCRRGVIDVGAIANHSRCIAEEVPEGPLISAEEVMTDLGEVIGLFVTDQIEPGAHQQVLQAIRTQGGITVLPHPYKGHRRVEHLASLVDAVEVANGRTDPERNRRALELALKLGKPMLAGSDAHFPFEIGQCGVYLDTDSIEAEAVRAAILTQRNPSRVWVRKIRTRTKHLSYLVKLLRRVQPATVARVSRS
jgi:predicted metal-dependent phosphoesterase TrpH